MITTLLGVLLHVQVLPIISQRDQTLSCCETVIEFSKTADATLIVQNSAHGPVYKASARLKF